MNNDKSLTGVAMFGQHDNQNQWQNQGSQPGPQDQQGAPDHVVAAADDAFAGGNGLGHPQPAPAQQPAPGIAPAPEDGSHTLPQHGTVSNDDLLSIKQEALQQLGPLVGHLEQSPEEKFRTTMMMIQASDDHSLLQSAYDTAKQIQDEKVRAQALLDIVNEINYFTQQKQEQ